jgi:hypothetical protein
MQVQATAERSKWACYRQFAGTVCLNPAGGMDVCLLCVCVCVCSVLSGRDVSA